MPSTNRVIRSRDVKIDEASRYQPPAVREHLQVAEHEARRLQRVQDLLDTLHADRDWLEMLDEDKGVEQLPLINIDVAPTAKGDPVQLMTPEATPEPGSRPQANSNPTAGQ